MSDVVHNSGRSRFELAIGGEVAIAAYRREGSMIVITHTLVPATLEGRGMGGRLIAGALSHVRQRGEKIVPACTFVAHYVATHPESRDLLAP